MQLRRDTDYALRILFCVGRPDVYERCARAGKTLLEVCLETGIPKIKALRVCEKLEAGGFLRTVKKSGSDITLYPADRVFERTMRDVAVAMENGVNLFAVFDKRSEMFRRNERNFLDLRGRIEKFFADTTLETLFSPK